MCTKYEVCMYAQWTKHDPGSLVDKPNEPKTSKIRDCPGLTCGGAGLLS